MSLAFDAIIIGAGQAGPPLAGRLTQAGQSVALIERHLFGGTCVNTGCMPTKTLVASAEAAYMARRAAEYGLSVGPVGVDMKAVKARKDAVVQHARDGVRGYLDGMAGCRVFEGHARFTGPHTLQVGEQTLTADQIFVNVGGRALVPPMPGIDQVSVMTSTSILALDTVPSHLVVVGGSYVGLEFAQMVRRFGAQVTVVEKGPRLVGREDPDISEAIQGILAAEGIALRLSAECISFAPHGNAVAVGVDCTEGEPSIVGSHVLLAVGRRPNTDDLGLEQAGVTLDARGFIVVDDQLRSTAPGIWALGDCNGRGAFTHTAYNDFEIVADNLLDGASRRVSDRIPAYALYTDPPLGRVGLTEAQAVQAGHRVRVATRPMTRVGRAIEKGRTEGFMKIVVDADSNLILGAAILGIGGDEVVHGVLDTMAAGVAYTVLQHAVPIHPTVSELLPTLLGALMP